MPISIKRSKHNAISAAGTAVFTIRRIQEVKNATTRYGVFDVIVIYGNTPSGTASARCHQFLDERSLLGKFIAAVNHGSIPDQVNNVEALLLDKEVQVCIEHHTSSKNGVTYANVVDVYAAPVPYADASESYDDDGESDWYEPIYDDSDRYDPYGDAPEKNYFMDPNGDAPDRIFEKSAKKQATVIANKKVRRQPVQQTAPSVKSATAATGKKARRH